MSGGTRSPFPDKTSIFYGSAFVALFMAAAVACIWAWGDIAVFYFLCALLGAWLFAVLTFSVAVFIESLKSWRNDPTDHPPMN